MLIKVSVAIVSLAVLLTATPVLAHHAFSAEFDADRPMQLQGTVTKTEWINPHSWIHIEVKDDDGNVENWAIECGAMVPKTGPTQPMLETLRCPTARSSMQGLLVPVHQVNRRSRI